MAYEGKTAKLNELQRSRVVRESRIGHRGDVPAAASSRAHATLI
jgi:hypothetical protein